MIARTCTHLYRREYSTNFEAGFVKEALDVYSEKLATVPDLPRDVVPPQLEHHAAAADFVRPTPLLHNTCISANPTPSLSTTTTATITVSSSNLWTMTTDTINSNPRTEI
ncbi:hypothetical protein Y032_0157g3213 [Ancylostoma ceylanicum]|uniref:Uncharacterized protein n=1 Tax=Ancylostoma ceylanicum TaxID=53326 RepID=A0A016SZD8_9BILA|nr:hypothetical protein Y032_0157g3213 [Ancylostoma ceylanicum]